MQIETLRTAYIEKWQILLRFQSHGTENKKYKRLREFSNNNYTAVLIEYSNTKACG